MSRRWHSAARVESLGQNHPKGSSGLDSFIAIASVLWLADSGAVCNGICKVGRQVLSG